MPSDLTIDANDGHLCVFTIDTQIIFLVCYVDYNIISLSFSLFRPGADSMKHLHLILINLPVYFLTKLVQPTKAFISQKVQPGNA